MKPRACANCGVTTWIESDNRIHCNRCAKRIKAKRERLKATRSLDRQALIESRKRQ